MGSLTDRGKKMKIKLYTKGHDKALLKGIGSGDEQFTAATHAHVVEREYGKHFETKESLIQWYLAQSHNSDKLLALAFLIRHCNENEYKNVLSLGAGPCVLEYLLKCALPDDAKVVAIDFDSFFIKKAKLHFPSIIPAEFDFFKGNPSDLQKLKIDFDIAVFFGSSYVMDDPDFIRQLSGLKKIGVKRIIDFQAGYIPWRRLPIIILSKVITKINPRRYRGKFHGYGRSRGELRRLYKLAGLELIQEISVAPYKYVAILE
jgi:ubiquinone/menaquinone biosynthesis C-methylase UbiE